MMIARINENDSVVLKYFLYFRYTKPNKMKKSLIAFSLLFVIASCSKSSTGNNNNNSGVPTGTLTATIDGTDMTFNYYPTGVHVTSSGLYSVAFAGYNG